ncbi:helix-turn-helix domain-containing protein [Maritalea mobilis]|uniref:helix-turn-helix domain-containing protein n=1 Tax=Maritalea mobilis TaxID=483324 RepID=UPI001060DEC3|nr:helix-turn-helix transcriptional regulator [Maritalea mobilis]
MNDICDIIAANVRLFREIKGISQEELAHRTNLDRTYISGIERGVRNPTIRVLERLASALDVDICGLISGR